MSEKINGTQNRRIYDAVKGAIGDRSFLVIVPEPKGITFCVGDLDEQQVKKIVKEAFVCSLRIADEVENCPPPA